MPKPQPISPARKVVQTLYGNSGIGKTRLLGEASVPTLIVHPPIEHMGSIRRGAPEEIIVRSWEDMWSVEEQAKRGRFKKYAWVWFDSISAFQNVGLDDLWEQVIDEKPSRKRYGLDQAEYGINMSRLMRWCRTMVGVPGFNFGVTSHPANVDGLRTPDEPILGPWVQGKNMPHQLVQMSTIVAYYEFDSKDRRVLRTKLTDDYFAKDQYDALGDMRNPTMDKVIEAIKTSRPRTRKAGGRTGTRRRAVRSTQSKGA